MKIRRIKINNVKSFKSQVDLMLNNDLNIFIGPNGGGKSNLLSIITIVMNQYFFTQFQLKFEASPEGGSREVLNNKAVFNNINLDLEKYFDDPSDSTITVEIQSDEADYKNMLVLKQNKDIIFNRINKYSSNYRINFPDAWPDAFVNSQVMKFEINNNQLVPPNEDSTESAYLYYLKNYNQLKYFTKEFTTLQLFSPLIFFSPHRNLQDNFTIEESALKREEYNNRISSLAHYQSKAANMSLAEIAVFHFGMKKHQYEHQAAYERDKVANEIFNDDDDVKLLTKYLKKIGYEWSIQLDSLTHQYKFHLTQNEHKVNISKASSGEKEIINILLGIFSLNVQDGIVFIDEPELHLHPRWQNLLLEVITELSEKKNNQFILATHSPTFVNTKTYYSITRVFKNSHNESKIMTFNKDEIHDVKSLLHIINSTNNERMFFADVVILVEGITDKLVFSKMMEELNSVNQKSNVIEIIEVDGKHNLDKYHKFVEGLKIHSFIIADLDYVTDIGDATLRGLFNDNGKKIANDVLKSKKSLDGKALVASLETAIKNDDTRELKELWKYIKSFRQELKNDLSPQDKKILEDFISDQSEKGVYILSDGDIESYFMDGFKSKDLDKVLSLLQNENYSAWKADDQSGYTKLYNIMEEIHTKAENS
jgi:putative ATP-dependent endonuclease of the OLD family